MACSEPNQSLQQTKPPVTSRACARPAPAVFAAEAQRYTDRIEVNG